MRKIPETTLVYPVAETIRAALKQIAGLAYVTVAAAPNTPDEVWVMASNKLSNGHPLTKPGSSGVTGVAIVLQKPRGTFYEITSAQPGAGKKMVEAVLRAAPSYKFAVYADLSGGFWTEMAKRHPDRFIESDPNNDEHVEFSDPRHDTDWYYGDPTRT